MQIQPIQLNLDEMTVSEKLTAINRIWDNILQHPDEIPLPEWHKEILASRSARVNEGLGQFKNLSSVKQEFLLKFK